VIQPPDNTAPRQLVDPTTGRTILMAPQRQQRPIHTGPARVARPCPFCPGQEHETPPELSAVRAPGSAADRPGWRVRAFANKYPACAHHEVIAEGDRHCEQPSDLDVSVWRDTLLVWQQRTAAIELRADVRATFLFKNVGAAAGASIAHNHSQLLGLTTVPPRLLLELAQARAAGRCPWCADLATAGAGGRVVFAAAAHTVLVPDPPKLPFETWLLPNRCDDDFLSTDLDSAAAALHALFVAVAGALGKPAFNMWLHRMPGEAFHWHLELQPRTGQMAGLELGGDMYINSVPAAAAAARLRSALSPG